jgi:hypothetical protein
MTRKPTEEHLARIADLLAAEEAKTPRAGGVHAWRRLLAIVVILLIVAVIVAARH